MILKFSNLEYWIEDSDSAKYLLSQVSPAQARRWSDYTKLAVDIALKASRETKIDHVISASRHGEISTSASLIKMIQKKEVLSPMLFSQSVHNSAVGVYSIQTNCLAGTTAISAGADTFFSGLVSAFCFLQSQPKANVLFIAADTKIPAEYAKDLDEDNFSYALAMVVRSDNCDTGTKINLRDIRTQDKTPQAVHFLKRVIDVQKN